MVVALIPWACHFRISSRNGSTLETFWGALRGVLWNLTQWIQPILRERNAMDRLHRRPAYVLGPRNLASGFAHSQTLNDLPYFEPLEPPVSHRVPPKKILQGNAIKKSK